MKKLLMILALVGGLSFAANAQKKVEKTPAQKAGNKTEHLQKNLKLTADQSKKVNAILLAQATSIDSLKKLKQDKKTSHLADQKIKQRTNASLNKVFTPEQQKAFAKLKADKKAKKDAAKKGAE
jgi:Spy/CpxP family protein refolding chaperone